MFCSCCKAFRVISVLGDFVVDGVSVVDVVLSASLSVCCVVVDVVPRQ